MEDVQQILTIIENWAADIGVYAVTLAAVGTFSMALLEALKGIFKIKAAYHERSLKRWLRDDLISYLANSDILKSELFKDLDLNIIKDNGVREIISLATGVPQKEINIDTAHVGVYAIGAERSLYTLSLDKLMGQIQESVDIVLENPVRYVAAYLLLCCTASESDIEEWYKHAQLITEQGSNGAKKGLDPQIIARIGKRIQQSVQRQLDTFQLQTDYFWSRWNQITSLLLGFFVLFTAIVVSRITLDGSNITFGEIFKIFMLSILGGFIAPVAKDLVTSLRKVKNRE